MFAFVAAAAAGPLKSRPEAAPKAPSQAQSGGRREETAAGVVRLAHERLTPIEAAVVATLLYQQDPLAARWSESFAKAAAAGAEAEKAFEAVAWRMRSSLPEKAAGLRTGPLVRSGGSEGPAAKLRLLNAFLLRLLPKERFDEFSAGLRESSQAGRRALVAFLKPYEAAMDRELQLVEASKGGGVDWDSLEAGESFARLERHIDEARQIRKSLSKAGRKGGPW